MIKNYIKNYYVFDINAEYYYVTYDSAYILLLQILNINFLQRDIYISENFVMKFKEIVNKGMAEEKESHKVNYEWKIVWRNVIIFIYIHLAAIYGLYLTFRYANLLTFMWCTYLFMSFYIHISS